MLLFPPDYTFSTRRMATTFRTLSPRDDLLRRKVEDLENRLAQTASDLAEQHALNLSLSAHIDALNSIIAAQKASARKAHHRAAGEVAFLRKRREQDQEEAAKQLDALRDENESLKVSPDVPNLTPIGHPDVCVRAR